MTLIVLFLAYPEQFGNPGGLAKVTYSGKLYDKCNGLPFTQERRFDSGFVFKFSHLSPNYEIIVALSGFNTRDIIFEHAKRSIANSQLMQVPMN